MFSSMSPAERVPQAHPLRRLRVMVDAGLKALWPQCDRLDSHTGRPSIAPAPLRRARWLPGLDTVRSERLLRAQRNDHRLLRWCVGRNLDDPLGDASTGRKPRERVREGDIAQAFFARVWAQARARALRSDEPCTGDGTRIEAWAGQQRCKRTGVEPPEPPDDPGNPSMDCRGERRTHATHASTTAPEARLSTKATGQAAKLASLGHVLLEHRHGWVGDRRVPQATGTAAREAALAMAEAMPGHHRVTVGADQHDATHARVRARRARRVTPHVAQQTTGRSSAMEGRTTPHPGYAVRQRKRTCVAERLGWMKPVGLLRQLRHRGAARVGGLVPCTAAVYNLGRMRRLAAAYARGKDGSWSHLGTSRPRANPGTRNLVIFQKSAHGASRIFAKPLFHT